MTNATTDQSRPYTLSAELPKETLVGWLRDMILIREFELRTMAAYQQAKIGGFCHVYIGQEPVVVGTFAALEHADPIVTAYRDHGHALARGMHPNACMAEMYGKLPGCAKGKGGSMHMFDKPNNLFGGHGIVGAQTPLGLGLAFAARYENEVVKESVNYNGDAPAKRVALAFLGDGAMNQGAFHEALNLSNLDGQLRSPVIFIVENNKYSMGTSIERGTTMAHDMKTKADAYGIDYLETDASDILRLYDDFKPFADACREEQKPGFVNLHCYRYQGHSMSDPQKYREKSEVEDYQSRDAIDNLTRYLVEERGLITQDEVDAIRKEAKKVSKEAQQFAEAAPEPSPETELYSDVYANIQPNLSPLDHYVHGSKNELL